MSVDDQFVSLAVAGTIVLDVFASATTEVAHHRQRGRYVGEDYSRRRLCVAIQSTKGIIYTFSIQPDKCFICYITALNSDGHQLDGLLYCGQHWNQHARPVEMLRQQLFALGSRLHMVALEYSEYVA